ncbi:hypothetical protein C8R45DRAFT_1096130 [Mycena sanguinolenta]|nr:hypothetical protein C8R45DRAFT_1096130 [Mycena sanguinolenta]
MDSLGHLLVSFALSFPDIPEYTLKLGAEISRSTTPLPSDSESTTNADVKPKSPPSPLPVRTRSWCPEGVEREQKARSTAYDAAGNLKLALRGRKAAARDCGWRSSPSKPNAAARYFVGSTSTRWWIYASTADGRCPACKAPCVLPPSRPLSPLSPSHAPSQYPLPASNTPTPSAERKDILGSNLSASKRHTHPTALPASLLAFVPTARERRFPRCGRRLRFVAEIHPPGHGRARAPPERDRRAFAAPRRA